MKYLAINRARLTVGAMLMIVLLLLPAIVSAQREAGQGRAEPTRGAGEHGRSIDDAREARIAEIQERVAERRVQVRQDVCQRQQEQISQLIPRLASQSTRLQSAIDNVYQRVQTFYESGQLTVENYDELNAAVAVSQAEAHGAVQAVANYEFEFDCDTPSLGNRTLGFREAVAEAREALKEYRADLVTLISSLRSAAAEQATEEGINGTGQVDEGTTTEEEIDAEN